MSAQTSPRESTTPAPSASRDVLFLSTSDMIWGAERSMLTIARLVDRLPGHRVAVASPNPALRTAWGERARFAALPASGGPLRRVLLGFVGLIRFAPRSGTVVVFDLLTLPAVAVLRPWLRRRGVGVVLDVHDSIETRPRLRTVLWLARAVDRAVCVSEYIAAQLPRTTRRTVVHRPIEAPAHAERTSGRPVVAIIGVVLPHKNLKLGLEAAALATSPFQLLVVGEAPTSEHAYAAEIDAEGERLLGDRYARVPTRPHAEVFAGVDVLLFLNATEPSGRVIAEAQAAGVAVVCTDRGGAAEFVIDGETGYRFRADDPAAAAAAIDRAVSDDRDRRRVVDRARAWAEDHYAPDRQAERYAAELALA